MVDIVRHYKEGQVDWLALSWSTCSPVSFELARTPNGLETAAMAGMDVENSIWRSSGRPSWGAIERSLGSAIDLI